MGFLDRYASQILGITRIMAGFLFLAHGTAKMFNFPAREGWDGYNPMSLSGAAGGHRGDRRVTDRVGLL